MNIETVKIQTQGFIINGTMSVPNDPANTDYQAILDWINEGNTPEGPDVIEPDYVALRTGPDGYASTGDQLGMIADGTQAAHVADVKARFPKSNTGSITIGDVPQDILDAAADKQFAQQLEAYKTALDRLSQYQLSVGVPESSEEVVIRQDLNTDTGMMDDITETKTIPAIEPLEATVEQTTIDADGEATTTNVANPLIVADDAERAKAQSIIDSTPAPIKTHVDA